MKRFALPLALSLLLPWLAGCGSAGQPAAGPTGGAGQGTPSIQRVTLALDWYPNADHAGIYAAKAQGFDRQEGLDVNVQVPADPSAALQEVAAGKAEFAVNYEPEVLLARDRGIPVVAVMAIVQVPLNSIVTLASSGITRPKQLEGRKIGTDGLPNTEAILQTVLRADGADPAKVTQVNVGENNVQALLAGKVDAITGAYWNWEAVQVELKGQPVRVMRLDRWGVPPYDELVFVTSEKLARSQPDLVRRFVAAMAKGEAYAMAHPADALDFLLRANKDLDRELVRRSLELLAPVWQDGAPSLGYMDPAAWRSFEAWMRGHGLLKSDVDVSQAMTDAFLPR